MGDADSATMAPPQVSASSMRTWKKGPPPPWHRTSAMRWRRHEKRLDGILLYFSGIMWHLTMNWSYLLCCFFHGSLVLRIYLLVLHIVSKKVVTNPKSQPAIESQVFGTGHCLGMEVSPECDERIKKTSHAWCTDCRGKPMISFSFHRLLEKIYGYLRYGSAWQ